MGRIKTKQIKSIANDIAEEHLEEFKPDFAENKKILETILDVPSKKLRNIIAGYMTRLVRMKKDIQ